MPDALDTMTEEGGAPAAPARRPIPGQQAAAILMLLFSEEQAAEILARLEPEEVRQLSEMMYTVANIGAEDINEVLDMFIDKARNRTMLGYKAEEQIEGMLKRALGDRRAETMLTKIAPKKAGGGLEALKWMDPVEIALLVEHEHPQIAAVVLSFLKPEIAANVLQLLPPETQEDVVFRLATLGPVSPEAVETIEALLVSQGGAPRGGGGSASASGGTSDAAAIMNIINKRESQRIIKAVTKRDKDIARRIEDEMFVFADLIRLDAKDLGTLVRGLESKLLVPALKGAEDKLRDKMFGCMSSRAAQSIADEIADRGPMPMSEVIEAQRAVIQVAKRMADAGDIVIGGGGDEYV